MSDPMSSRSVDRGSDQGVTRSMILMVLAVTFALRIVHLSSALRSPLTFQPGPDEDFYFRFGQAVATGIGSGSPEFAFMDPAYGYILGLIFKLTGPGLFAVYSLQILLDTATAYCIFLVGRELDRPRAGLIGALLYGLTCTAVLFSTTLLKATWVSSYMVLWVLFAAALLKTRKAYTWLLFGMLCGYGVALRGNLVLMALFAAILLPWLNVVQAKRPVVESALRSVLLLVGLALPLALLGLRNYHISDSFSPLPNNGGVVLHQVYNAENPRSLSTIPSFVNYSNPSDIWRGYSREAEARLGHRLTPREVSQYWRGQAVEYIESHPADVIRNMARKLSEFVAYTEVPNNRSLGEERLFSPVLKALPSPFGWLFALGIPGIVLLTARDRRGLLLVAPILCTAITVAIFFAEDRFRFHAVPALALGAGAFVEDLYGWLRSHQPRKWVLGLVASTLLGGSSVLLAGRQPEPKITWERITWGYLKMGKMGEAKALATKIALEQPGNPSIQEALGYIAATEGNYPIAEERYRRATQLKPDSHVAHYNLARMLVKIGQEREAASEAAIALRIAPLPEYQKLLDDLTGKGAPN